MKNNNIKIEITNTLIRISHHGEILIEWVENQSVNNFIDMVKIAKAIQLASIGEITKLRVLLGKFLYVGTTNLLDIKDGVINYFITTLDKNGLKQQVNWTDCLDEILEVWRIMLEDDSNYNMTLCKVIVVEKELGLDVVDVEIIKEHIK